MKKCMVTSLLLFLALLTVAATSSPAQVLIIVNVPFDFSAGHEVLPAGEYSIAPAGWGSQSLSLSSGTRGIELMVPKTTEARRDLDQTKLIFHRYGNEYFLAEMWTGAEGFVRTFPVHPRERQLIAKAGLTPEIAVVYGRPPATHGN